GQGVEARSCRDLPRFQTRRRTGHGSLQNQGTRASKAARGSDASPRRAAARDQARAARGKSRRGLSRQPGDRPEAAKEEEVRWLEPVITATSEEANAAQTGGTWRMEVRPGQGGGSVLTISMDRKAKGLVGHIIHGIFQLTNGQFLAARTKKMLANIRRVNSSRPG